ncbi:MAG: redoxin domain-containing protein [Verrucomicrobiae bacterium]|nr:redoxin domain-containing protein [Verrucomicrobiae bacterium]
MENPESSRVGTRLALVLIVPLLALAGGCGDNPAPGPAADSAPRSAPIPASATPAGPADQAWAHFQAVYSNPPQPPASWAEGPPDEDALRTFQLERGAAAVKVADVARDFYQAHPDDPRAVPARWHEMQLLDAAVKLGHTNALPRLLTLEKERLEDPSLTEDERFGVRMAGEQRAAELLFPQGEEVARRALEEAALRLAREFPGRSEPYQVLLNLAGGAAPERARELVTPLLNPELPEEVREGAQALLTKLDRVGKPLDLKFTAIDGREIDLSKMTGKVVLIDFWATWCGPCIAELPSLKETYEKLHPRGFEILGISFDQEKEALERLVAREKLRWPQYFDGAEGTESLGERFGIESIPTLWLVDKKGVLRHLDARNDLEAKVLALLAEE